MIEMIHGKGTIEKRIPAMLRMYLNYDIDMREVPILVYPTLHLSLIHISARPIRW